jgi:hypothetical protein
MKKHLLFLPGLWKKLEIGCCFSVRTLTLCRAHKEEAQQTAAREADLPAIKHKTWQAENPDILLGRTWQTSACHCSSPSGLPTN